MTTQNAEIYNLVNDHAEANIVSGVRYGSDAEIQSLLATVTFEDFADRGKAVLYQACANVYRSMEPLTNDTVLAEARRVAADVKFKSQITPAWIEAIPDEFGDVAGHAHTVKRLAWLRGAAGVCEEFLARITMQPSIEEFYAWAQGEWQVLAPQTVKSGFVYGWDTVEYHDGVIRQRIEDREQGRPRFDWPWQSWNSRIRPLRGGMLGVIGAPDGAGKSALLSQIAEHWSAKGRVVLVHLEDALDYKLDRRLARYSSIPYDAIEDGNFSAAQWQRKHDIENWLAEQPFVQNLHYYHAPGKSMSEIVRELESRVEEGECEAVVVDYLNKVQSDSRQVKVFGSSKYERQADDVEQLKTFAERASIPVMTASQGNANILSQIKDMGREDLYGSKQTSHKSQLVLMMRRKTLEEDFHDPASGDLIAETGEDSPVTEFRIDKQNRGQKGDFKMWYQGETFTFQDMEYNRHDLNDHDSYADHRNATQPQGG